MPEIKHTFTGGKMNKDLDERLVPNGEYRDANNIQVRTTDGDAAGTVQGIKGNTLMDSYEDITNPTTGEKIKTIGSIVDEKNDNIYAFMAAPPSSGISLSSVVNTTIFTDSIVEQNVDGTTSPVVIDEHTIVTTTGIAFTAASGGSPSDNFTSYQGDYWYEIIIRDSIIAEKIKVGMKIELLTAEGENKLPNAVIKNIYVADDNITRVALHKGFLLSTVESYVNNATVWVKFSNQKVLNFDYDYNITGINIIDNLLFWTDGSSEPKKINIDRCKAGTSVSSSQVDEYVYNGDFSEDISLTTEWYTQGNATIGNTIAPSVYQGNAVEEVEYVLNHDFSCYSCLGGIGWEVTGNLQFNNSPNVPSVNWTGDIEDNAEIGGAYPNNYGMSLNGVSTWNVTEAAGNPTGGGQLKQTITGLTVGQEYTFSFGYGLVTNNLIISLNQQGGGTQYQTTTINGTGQQTQTVLIDGNGTVTLHVHGSNTYPDFSANNLVNGYLYYVSLKSISDAPPLGGRLYLNGLEDWNNYSLDNPGYSQYDSGATGGNGDLVHLVTGLTPGDTYTFSFDYEVLQNTLRVQAFNVYQTSDGSTVNPFIQDFTTTSGPNGNGIGTAMANITAITSQMNIHFSGTDTAVASQGAVNAYIDNVSVSQTSTTNLYNTQLYVEDPTDVGSQSFIPITDLEYYNFEGEKVYGDLKEEHITVIKKAPRTAPTLVLNSTDRGEGLTEVDITDSPFSLSSTNETGQLSVGDVNIFSHINFAQTIYRINDLLDFTTVYEDTAGTITESIRVTCKFVEYISENGQGVTESTSTIKVEVMSWEGENFSSGITDWNVKLKQKPPLFELKLGRFAYRYKYEDGEYSSIGPWSELAFLPGNFDYEAHKGYNLGMTNRVREIIIKDFVPFKNRPLDVSSVDIIYKTSDSPNIYVVKTISRGIDAEWDLFTPNSIDATQKLSGQLSLTSETIHRVLSEDQALRSWDNVPRYAISQEITSNRLLFGNYVQGYNVQLPVGLIQEVIGESSESPKTPSKSIKSIRDYKWGVVFGDKYGRETPVFTSGYTSGYSDDFSSTTGDVSLSKEYSSTKNYFRLKQQWDNPVNSNNSPPSWAEYVKYYVKETSNEYYNLVLNRWYYADKNGKTVWLSFQSTDRNKIDEETYLILKTKNGEAVPVKEETRYRVIAIENEAPDYVKTKHLRLGEIIASPGSASTGTTMWADEATNVTTTQPINLLDTTTNFITIDYGEWDSLFGAGMTSVSDLNKDRSKISVQIIGEDTDGVKKFSKWNEVTNWKPSGGGSAFGISQPSDFDVYYADNWGDDADMVTRFINDNSLNWSGGTVNGLTYKLAFKQEILENKPQFDGRFFVKVEADSILESNVMLISDQSDKYTVVTSKSVGYIYTKSNTNPATIGTYAGETWTYGQGGGWFHNSFEGVNNWTSWGSGGGSIPWDGLQEDLNSTAYCGKVMSTSGGTGPHSYSDAVSWANEDYNNGSGNFSAPSVSGSTAFNTPDATLVIPDAIEEAFGYYCWRTVTGNFWQSRHTSKPGEPFIDEARAPGQSTFTTSDNGLFAGNISSSLSSSVGLNGVTSPTVGLGGIMISVVGYTAFGDMPSGTQFFFDEMRTIGTQFRFSGDPGNQYKVIDIDENTSIRNNMTWSIDYGSCGPGCCGNDGSIVTNTGGGSNARIGVKIYFRKVDTATNKLLNEGINSSVWDPRGTIRHDGTQSLTMEVLRHQEFGGEALIFEKDLSIFETEPKKDVDLEIYYEGSDSIPLILNDININDFAPIDCGISIERFNHLFLQKVTLPLETAGNIITAPPNKVANNTGKPDIFNSSIDDLQTNTFYGINDPIIHIVNQLEGSDDATDQANGIYIGDDIIFNQKSGDRLRSKVTGFFTKNITTGSSYYSPSNVIGSKIKALVSGSAGFTSDGGIGSAWDPAVGSYLNIISITDTTNINDIEAGMQLVFAEHDTDGINAADLGVVVAEVNTTNNTVKLTSSINSPFYFSKYETNGDIIRRTSSQFVEGGADGEEYTVEFVKPTAHYSIDRNVWKYHVDLNWSNCYSYGNGAESDRIRDDFNAPQIGNGIKVSTTFSGYKKENKTSGLIYSGIYNSTSEVNNLNEFNMSQQITKDLNPSYGSIQRLKTRDTDVIVLTEDKVLKVLSSKDALFNADGNPQLTASNRVLGTAMPFVGDYGISKNPESLAFDQYRMYFTDKQRGAVLRLSQDGLTPISNVGMKSWFRDNLRKNDKALGTFDVVSGEYNLTLTKSNPAYGFTDEDWICYANRYEDLLAAHGYNIDGLRNHYITYGVNEGRVVSCDGTDTSNVTVSFSEESKGWVSFKTFLPEAGGSVSGQYITIKGSAIYKHYANSLYNCFYGVDPSMNQSYESSISVLFNDTPGVVKSFNSVNYEGSQSRIVQNTSDTNEFYNLENKPGWYVSSIITDKQSGTVPEFIEKEGKWFNKISGTTTTLANLDTGEFTVQGIGNPHSVSGVYT